MKKGTEFYLMMSNKENIKQTLKLTRLWDDKRSLDQRICILHS